MLTKARKADATATLSVMPLILATYCNGTQLYQRWFHTVGKAVFLLFSGVWASCGLNSAIPEGGTAWEIIPAKANKGKGARTNA